MSRNAVVPLHAPPYVCAQCDGPISPSSPCCLIPLPCAPPTLTWTLTYALQHRRLLCGQQGAATAAERRDRSDDRDRARQRPERADRRDGALHRGRAARDARARRRERRQAGGRVRDGRAGAAAARLPCAAAALPAGHAHRAVPLAVEDTLRRRAQPLGDAAPAADGREPPLAPRAGGVAALAIATLAARREPAAAAGAAGAPRRPRAPRQSHPQEGGPRPSAWTARAPWVGEGVRRVEGVRCGGKAGHGTRADTLEELVYLVLEPCVGIAP
eukprot:5227033-Prymnesium_polylepis.3